MRSVIRAVLVLEDADDEMIAALTEHIQQTGGRLGMPIVDVAVTAHPFPEIRYVNAYRVCRNYGGPEEGGWWYDSGEPLASIPCKDDWQIKDAKEKLTEMMGWKDKYSRYSVLGGDDFEIYVEDHPAVAFPAQRPHYE